MCGVSSQPPLTAFNVSPRHNVFSPFFGLISTFCTRRLCLTIITFSITVSRAGKKTPSGLTDVSGRIDIYCKTNQSWGEKFSFAGCRLKGDGRRFETETVAVRTGNKSRFRPIGKYVVPEAAGAFLAKMPAFWESFHCFVCLSVFCAPFLGVPRHSASRAGARRLKHSLASIYHVSTCILAFILRRFCIKPP